MAAEEDLQPTTANNHSVGAASLQQPGDPDGNQEQQANAAGGGSKGNWVYKTRKLYQNQPSRIRYVAIALVIIVMVVIVAGIGVAIGKAAGKTEVQHLSLVHGGVRYQSQVVIVGESVQISVMFMQGFTTGPAEIVLDFAQKVAALNDQKASSCFVRILGEESVSSVEKFSDALESTWTDVLNLTESVSGTVRWRTAPLSSQFVRKPHAADSMTCDDGGDYEVLSALALTDPDPTQGRVAPIRAGFTQRDTCDQSCFPRFTVVSGDGGMTKLAVTTRDCFFYGNCQY